MSFSADGSGDDVEGELICLAYTYIDEYHLSGLCWMLHHAWHVWICTTSCTRDPLRGAHL